MKFDKYENFGAYHFRQYEQGGKYTRHVDRIIQWVKERPILDVGAGDGLITFKLGAIGLDNEPTAIDLAKTKGANVIWGNAYELPYDRDAFEAITMFDVLEHFDKPEKALAEARRVAPVLYISTPPKRDSGRLTDKYHVQEWSPQGFEELLKQNGYALVGGITVYPSEKVMYGKFKRK